MVAVQSSSRVIDDLISGLPRQAGTKSVGAGLQLPCVQSIMVARDDVHTALHSLAGTFKSGGRASQRERERDSVGSQGSARRSLEGSNASVGSNSSHTSQPPRNRTVPKIVYTLAGPVPVPASKDAQWV